MANWLHPNQKIDFVSKRKVAGLISTVLVFASIALFVFVGPTWGIDFTGGTEMHLKFQDDTPIEDLRSALSAEGLSDDSV